MANLTSVLAVRLLDQVSAPAKKATGAIRSLQNTANRASGVTAVAARAGDAATLATTRLLGAAGGLAGAAMGARAAIASFAELERQMNRVGVTADASMTEVKAATGDIAKIADQVGVPIEAVIAGLEALVAAGRSLPQSMEFLPSIVATAHASGAATEDVAASADALARSFGIAGQEMGAALDILVAGGNAGRFELRDLARYLPSISAAAAAVGLKGQKGLKKTVAMLQTIREQTGSSEEAATSMVNIFAKMESDETAKRFRKFGVDLRKEMADARREGRDLTEVFVDLADVAIKGDLSRIPQLFSDMEMARGMRALLSNRAALQGYMNTLDQSAGAVGNALRRVSGDTQSELDRLSNRWAEFAREIGALAAGPGISMMQSLQEELRTARDELSDFSDWVKSKTGFSLSEIADIAGRQLGVSSPGDIKAANDRREAERADPNLARAREAREASAALDEKIRLAEADVERAEAAEKKSSLSRGRGDQARQQLGRLRLQKAELDLAARARSEPPPGPVDVPVDREAGRSSFHSYRVRREAIEAAKAEAGAQGAAVPVPQQDPRRAPAIDIVPVAPLDDTSSALTKILGELSALTETAFGSGIRSEASSGGAALGDLSTKAGEARAALDQVGATTVAPQVNTGSIDEALAKAERLKATLVTINGMRMQVPSGLGQSLRGVHADVEIGD